jgi:hypothetical protein
MNSKIMDIKVKKIINEEIMFLNEYYFNKTTWFWVSPENGLITVPRLNHKDFIMRKYRNEPYGWNYDRVFDQATEDGWVRGVFEKNERNFSANLNLYGVDKKRVVGVLKELFYGTIKYGNNTIYLDYVNDKSDSFSTRDFDGKERLEIFIKNT